MKQIKNQWWWCMLFIIFIILCYC